MAEEKKKKGFKMPHLLFLMLGLIMFMSAMTYIIPAGEYVLNPDTNTLMGDSFHYIGEQSPVSPVQALMFLLPGLQNSSMVISMLLMGGGTTGIVLTTGAIDDLISWAIYKLKDSGTSVLVPLMCMMIGLLGAFGGGDSLVAIVPIGVMFAKKLKLDPIMAAAVTFMASMVGFATGPTKLMVPQMMLDIPIYSGFAMRCALMMIALVVNAIYTTWYAKRIQKDPTKSAMGNTDWLKDLENSEIEELAEVVFSPKSALVTFLYFGQYAVIVYLMLVKGFTNAVTPAIQIVVAISCGFIYGMKPDEIGAAHARGVAGMGFVGVVIGMAGCMSLVMSTGKIIHTFVYVLSLPLKNLSGGFIAVGVSIVVMIINLFIPSASSKAAILIPIIRPLVESLGVPGQMAAQAFQVGDGFTNSITPSLGWTAGSLQTAGVSFPQWWKYSLPLVGILMVIAWVEIYFLGVTGWTGV
jgi:Predicted membrane protein